MPLTVVDTLSILSRIGGPLFYALASIGFIAAFAANRPSPYGWTRPLFAIGILFQTLVLVLLVFKHRQFPIETVFEGLALCSWILSLLIAARIRSLREPCFGAFLFPANFILVLVAMIFLGRGTPLPREMQSYFFIVHVTLLFAAYACFVFSFVVSIMYLLQHHAIRSHSLGAFYDRLPPLETMDHSVKHADALGLLLLIMGLVMGFLWLHVSVGTPYGIHMKIGLSVLTALVYLSEHMLRIGKGWEGQRACLISIAGFVLVLCTLMAGRHGF